MKNIKTSTGLIKKIRLHSVLSEETLASDRGNVAIIVAICLVALILFTALVVDVGSLYEERRSLQTVADSAALAGAQELPESPDSATQIAIEYAANHDVNIDSGDVVISSTLATNDTITVTPVIPNSPLYFARVIGMDSAPVGARAKAIIASLSVYTGVVPWGIPEQPEGGWVGGTQYVLKWGSGPLGESWQGNFQPLALDKPGGNEYKNNIIEGCSTGLYVGLSVDTQTGNLVGPTTKGTETRVGADTLLPVWDDFYDLATLWLDSWWKNSVPDSQCIIVPIIPPLVEATGKEEVEILGFAPFIITGIEDMEGDSEYGNGVAITGKLLDQALIVRDGPIAPVTPQGIRVIRLIE